MNQNQKQEILDKFKKWFKDSLIANHQKNTKKLVNVQEFNINPFLLYYLANYLEGDSSSKSLAKVLVYPRVLGTSITTTFGNKMQEFISEVLDTYGSITDGIDIEFIDQIDKRKKYCQLKSGPNAINKDDVKTIFDHFTDIRNLAKKNNLKLEYGDLVFALSYGEEGEANSFIKQLKETDVVVLIGKEFWHRFTGDENFYYSLIAAAGEVAKEINMKEIVEGVIDELSGQIEERFKELFEKEEH